MTHRPAWFRDGEVFVSYAATVGINKDGNTLFAVDNKTGRRTADIDDEVTNDIEAVISGTPPKHGRWVSADEFKVAVPAYYNREHVARLDDLMTRLAEPKLVVRSIGDLVATGKIEVRVGHGSPSADVRDGDIPYIKVSDIRAGQVNINPTNMVGQVVAERFWRGTDSGLVAFDLVTPMRASKNIGEFAILMPGQEQAVFTKEVLFVRASPTAKVDNFFLMWALSLTAVREQWNRVVFMQTNREDVGKRYLEIEIPWTDSPKASDELSSAFRNYYLGMVELRRDFAASLAKNGDHHVFLGDTSAS